MREVFKVLTKSEGETKKFAEIFAKELLNLKSPKAIVVGLEGELGAGKTVFAKGFAKGLGIKEEMKSPSFILMRVFRISRDAISGSRDRISGYFFHIDAWRDQFDFSGYLKNPQNILLVEWAERAKKFLPKNYFKFSFKVLGKNVREITLWR